MILDSADLQNSVQTHIPCSCRRPYRCPAAFAFKFLIVLKWQTLPMLNKKQLDRRRQELFWRLSSTHTSNCFAVFIASESPIQKIFKIIYDRQQQRQTNKTDFLIPLSHTRHRAITVLSMSTSFSVIMCFRPHGPYAR